MPEAGDPPGGGQRADKIKVHCANPDCGQPFLVNAEFVGSKRRCPVCKSSMTIPKLWDEPSPEATLPDVPSPAVPSAEGEGPADAPIDSAGDAPGEAPGDGAETEAPPVGPAAADGPAATDGPGAIGGPPTAAWFTQDDLEPDETGEGGADRVASGSSRRTARSNGALDNAGPLEAGRLTEATRRGKEEAPGGADALSDEDVWEGLGGTPEEGHDEQDREHDGAADEAPDEAPDEGHDEEHEEYALSKQPASNDPARKALNRVSACRSAPLECASLIGRLKARIPKTRRGKIILVSVVLGVVFGIPGGAVGVWSSFPSFCRNCHHVVPYYDSWAASTHGKEHVACTDCHFKPGLVPYMMGKINGMVEVFKYATHSWGPKLRSEVLDISCLRSGCHSRDELANPDIDKAITFKGVKFSHGPHFEELRGGIELRCASCHALSLHSKSDTVSTTLCFTCHFAPGGEHETAEETELRKTAGECALCHDVPKEVKVAKASGGEHTFDHGKYSASAAECADCHVHVTMGDAALAERQCEFCHNADIERIDLVEGKGGPEGRKAIHEKHVAEHQVTCFECHADINHGMTRQLALASKQCGSCHLALDGEHAKVRNFFAGSSGAEAHGKPDEHARPDVMYLAGVGCGGCHAGAPDAKTAAKVAAAHGQSPREGGLRPGVVCAPCHEKGFEKLAARWKSAFGGYLVKLDKELDEARAKAASLPPGGGAAAALKEAEVVIERAIAEVRGGRAVHNVRYAAARLRDAEGALAKILGPGKLPGVGVMAASPMAALEKGAARCLNMCHLGVETTGTIKYVEQDFHHGRHVRSARVRCAECHSLEAAPPADEAHGKLSFARAASCNACHHKEEKKCASCHPVQAAVYLGKVAGDARSKISPMAKKKVACEGCHEGISKGHSRTSIRKLCQECHDDKKAYGRMLDEWQAGMGEEIERAEKLVAAAAAALKTRPDAVALRAARDRAVAATDLAKRDGSGGAHHLGYLFEALSEAADALEEALRSGK